MPILGKGSVLTPKVTAIELGGGRLRMGENSYINGGMIRCQGADIIIGNKCAISYNVHMIVNYGTRFFGQEKEKRVKKIVIGDYVWVGYGAMIRGGVTIGDFAIVGMGAIVVKDVPPFMIVGGNPAKIIRERPDKDIIMQKIKKGELESYRR